MSRSTFSILPYINRQKVKADGTANILCRITVDGKSAAISTGISCTPISIEANGEVINQRTMQVFVPYKYLYLFDEPRTAHVSFEGNDDASYNCNIISHNAKLIHREDGNYFMAIATVSTQGQNTPILQKYMKADVRIIVSNRTLWQQVFG